VEFFTKILESTLVGFSPPIRCSPAIALLPVLNYDVGGKNCSSASPPRPATPFPPFFFPFSCDFSSIRRHLPSGWFALFNICLIFFGALLIRSDLFPPSFVLFPRLTSLSAGYGAFKRPHQFVEEPIQTEVASSSLSPFVWRLSSIIWILSAKFAYLTFRFTHSPCF